MTPRASSHAIGKDLEDQVESLLRAWLVPYHRGYSIVTSFQSRFTVDFWLPPVPGRPAVVIEAKNFGVAALSIANSRGRKAQEALYLLTHVRRHCEQTCGARIVLIHGVETFATDQVSVLRAELGPDFHVVPISEPDKLRAQLFPGEAHHVEAPDPRTPPRATNSR